MDTSTETLPTRFGGKRVAWLMRVLAMAKVQPIVVECKSRKDADKLRWSLYHHKHKIEDAGTIRIKVEGNMVKLNFAPSQQVTVRTAET